MATAISAAEEESIREIVSAYETDANTIVVSFEQYRRKQFQQLNKKANDDSRAYLNQVETRLRTDLSTVKERSTAGKFKSYRQSAESELALLEDLCERFSS